MIPLDIRLQLKQCHTINEVYHLLNHLIFPGTFNTYFSNNPLLLPTSILKPSKMNVKLKGIFELAFRVITLLKFHGHIGDLPLNSGKKAYCYDLHHLLKNIQSDLGSIQRLDEIPVSSIDKYFSNRIENGYSFTHLSMRLFKIKEWITDANSQLPYFLRLDESLLSNASVCYQIYTGAQEEERQRQVLGSKRTPYPLNQLKTVLEKAMSYIANYSQDVLLVVKQYKHIKTLTQAKQKTQLRYHFANTTHQYSEPDLLKFQKLCQSKINREKITTTHLPSMNAMKKLEGACILIVTLMTGMRASELMTLERFPIFRHDDHAHLTRIVRKTAADEGGEEVEMPIPLIAKEAILILSKLAQIKDSKKTGPLINTTIMYTGVKELSHASYIRGMLKTYYNLINEKNPPTPHQLRHVMAFIIVYFNDKDGLELARMFLGHTSIKMTLRYMGHYNLYYQNAIKDLEEQEAKRLLHIISKEIKEGHNLYNYKGEHIMNNPSFLGSYVEDFADLLHQDLLQLVQEGELAILQTPICLCIHDRSSPNEMACQRGFNLDSFIGESPQPARCEGNICCSSIFTEQHIEDLKKQTQLLQDQYPKELRERLMQNTYFTDENLEEMTNPYTKIIKKYNEDKGKVSNG